MGPAAPLALLRGSVPTPPQVIVAIISFLETMLLIYLSYKVSAPRPGPAPEGPATDTLCQPPPSAPCTPSLSPQSHPLTSHWLSLSVSSAPTPCFLYLWFCFPLFQLLMVETQYKNIKWKISEIKNSRLAAIVSNPLISHTNPDHPSSILPGK